MAGEPIEETNPLYNRGRPPIKIVELSPAPHLERKELITRTFLVTVTVLFTICLAITLGLLMAVLMTLLLA